MRFGRLTVIDSAEDHIQKSGKHRTQWLCKCDCGNIIAVQSFNLKSGNSKSCGCLADEIRITNSLKHGDRHNRLYSIWCNIKQRCYNSKLPTYARWGGRGIKMCDEWKDSYTAFKEWSINNGYNNNLTIDRIDNNLGYTPDNCRWTTPKVQSNNRSTSVYFPYKGREYTLSELADATGIKYHTLFARVNKLGWSIDKAVSAPTR